MASTDTEAIKRMFCLILMHALEAQTRKLACEPAINSIRLQLMLWVWMWFGPEPQPQAGLVEPRNQSAAT